MIKNIKVNNEIKAFIIKNEECLIPRFGYILFEFSYGFRPHNSEYFYSLFYVFPNLFLSFGYAYLSFCNIII